MQYAIRPAEPADEHAIRALLPRLADFDVPKDRDPKHLWQGDEKMYLDWVAGKRNDIVAIVAEATTGIVGVAIMSYRPELLSGDSSVHLEVVAIDKAAEGHGIASKLIDQLETEAAANGAQSMSLHVFANNTKARALYERKGFDGELLRYTKPLG